MWTNEARPELERRSTGEVLVTRTIKTSGIGEGSVDEMAKPLYGTPGVGIGTYARADGVHLRIGAKAATREEAWSLIRPVEAEMDRIFGPAIWGRDDDTFEGGIADMMIAKRTTLATMESCTGGLLASTLTDVDGAGTYFQVGLVTYQTQEKINAGVPAEIIEQYGVYSAETAQAMAETVKRRFGTDYGCGITGVAGSEPMEGVTPGTVFIAVVGPSGEVQATTVTVAQGRAAVKRRAVTTALLMLRRALVANATAS